MTMTIEDRMRKGLAEFAKACLTTPNRRGFGTPRNRCDPSLRPTETDEHRFSRLISGIARSWRPLTVTGAVGIVPLQFQGGCGAH